MVDLTRNLSSTDLGHRQSRVQECRSNSRALGGKFKSTWSDSFSGRCDWQAMDPVEYICLSFWKVSFWPLILIIPTTMKWSSAPLLTSVWIIFYIISRKYCSRNSFGRWKATSVDQFSSHTWLTVLGYKWGDTWWTRGTHSSRNLTKVTESASPLQ